MANLMDRIARLERAIKPGHVNPHEVADRLLADLTNPNLDLSNQVIYPAEPGSLAARLIAELQREIDDDNSKTA